MKELSAYYRQDTELAAQSVVTESRRLLNGESEQNRVDPRGRLLVIKYKSALEGTVVEGDELVVCRLLRRNLNSYSEEWYEFNEGTPKRRVRTGVVTMTYDEESGTHRTQLVPTNETVKEAGLEYFNRFARGHKKKQTQIVLIQSNPFLAPQLIFISNFF